MFLIGIICKNLKPDYSQHKRKAQRKGKSMRIINHDRVVAEQTLIISFMFKMLPFLKKYNSNRHYDVCAVLDRV